MPVVRKICQIGGFLLLVSMFFCTISVSSYTPADPTWNLYMSKGPQAVKNLGGVVGASCADVMLLFFGGTIFLLLGIGGVITWSLLMGRMVTARAVLWRGLILLAAVGTVAALLYGDTRPLWGKFFAGGLVGDMLAASLVTYLNTTGALLVVATVVLLTFFVGREHPFLSTVGNSGVALGRSCLNSRQQIRRWGGIVRGSLIGCYSVPRRAGTAAYTWLQRARQQLPWNKEYEEQEYEESDEGNAQPETASQAVERLAPVYISPLTVSAPPPMTVSAPLVLEDAVVPTTPSQRALPERLHEQEHRSVSLAVPSPRVRQDLSPPLTGGSLPSTELLDRPAARQQGQGPEELDAQARFLEQKLREFGVEGEVVQVLPGPVITMYEFAPAAGVKVGKIVNLQDDLALVMRAISVRVVAPIPGKAVVGIEIPNRKRESVLLREILDTEEFRTSSSKLSLALGTDILGKAVTIDLALIPHLLVAGATGSGKSVGLNSLICSLLFHATPADVKLIMIDPKMLEFSVYDGIPHLLIPVVTDPKKAAVALRRVVEEMGRRYQLLAARGVRSIAQYNQSIVEEHRAGYVADQSDSAFGDRLTPGQKLPYLVVIIDELSDLMMVSSREVEDALMRIAQMARAAGIHLIVATQRPSVDVLTGVIKANFPARISFQVTSKVDSRTILDTNGAERLLGRGDMLFLAPGTSKPQRVHGAYVSEAEISRLVAEWKDIEHPAYDEDFLEPGDDQSDVTHDEYDEKYDEAVTLVAKTGQASISMLQRRLRVGYNRAARMIEIMEQEGIVGPADGVKPRTVLIRNTYDEM